MIPEYQVQFLKYHMGKVDEYRKALDGPISIEYSSLRYDFIARFLIAFERASMAMDMREPEFLCVLSHYLGLHNSRGPRDVQQMHIPKRIKTIEVESPTKERQVGDGLDFIVDR